jgi:hypothetical protein
VDDNGMKIAFRYNVRVGLVSFIGATSIGLSLIVLPSVSKASTDLEKVQALARDLPPAGSREGTVGAPGTLRRAIDAISDSNHFSHEVHMEFLSLTPGLLPVLEAEAKLYRALRVDIDRMDADGGYGTPWNPGKKKIDPGAKARWMVGDEFGLWVGLSRFSLLELELLFNKNGVGQTGFASLAAYVQGSAIGERLTSFLPTKIRDEARRIDQDFIDLTEKALHCKDSENLSAIATELEIVSGKKRMFQWQSDLFRNKIGEVLGFLTHLKTHPPKSDVELIQQVTTIGASFRFVWDHSKKIYERFKEGKGTRTEGLPPEAKNYIVFSSPLKDLLNMLSSHYSNVTLPPEGFEINGGPGVLKSYEPLLALQYLFAAAVAISRLPEIHHVSPIRTAITNGVRKMTGLRESSLAIANKIPPIGENELWDIFFKAAGFKASDTNKFCGQALLTVSQIPPK